MNTLSRTYILIGLFFVVSKIGGVAWGADSVVVSFDQDRAFFPGDLIELEISAYTNEFTRYGLREPRHGSVRHLETQSFPVRKGENEQYEQKWVVLYQVSRSGDILLEGGVLKDETHPENDPIDVEPVSIVSEGFGAEKDSNAPESLTYESDAKGRSPWIYVIVALAGIGVGAYGWWRKNKRVVSIVSEQRSPLQEAVEGLMTKLEGGQFPTCDLERFLRDYESACSPSLVEILERNVYSKSGQLPELKDRLRKEFSL